MPIIPSTEVIVAFMTGVLGPLLLKWYENKVKQKEKKDPVLMSNEYDVLISDELIEIRKNIKADRVYISQFHNGGHFYPTGKSMQKFSVLYETVSENATSIQAERKDIPASLFSRSINHVLKYDHFSIPDFEDDNATTYGLQYIKDSIETKSTYMFALKDTKDRFMGILTVDFTEYKTYLSNADINELKIQAARISGIMSEHLKN